METVSPDDTTKTLTTCCQGQQRRAGVCRKGAGAATVKKERIAVFDVSVSPLTRELLGFARQGMPRGMAMISIMDHARDCARYPVPRVLRLCFDDAVDRSYWQNLITREQAAAARDFVRALSDEVELLIVHCTEGVSRSAAVAAAILEAHGADAGWIWHDSRYRPNPLVYRLVREAFDVGGDT
jgi:predicted protein tyrosine phosphatase